MEVLKKNNWSCVMKKVTINEKLRLRSGKLRIIRESSSIYLLDDNVIKCERLESRFK